MHDTRLASVTLQVTSCCTSRTLQTSSDFKDHGVPAAKWIEHRLQQVSLSLSLFNIVFNRSLSPVSLATGLSLSRLACNRSLNLLSASLFPLCISSPALCARTPRESSENHSSNSITPSGNRESFQGSRSRCRCCWIYCCWQKVTGTCCTWRATCHDLRLPSS